MLDCIAPDRHLALFYALFGLANGYAATMMSVSLDIGMATAMELDDTQQSWLVTISAVVSIASSLAAGPLADWLGRRHAVLVSLVFMLLSGAVCAAADGFVVAMLGRGLGGVTYGLAVVAAPLHIAEVSSAARRGMNLFLVVMVAEIGEVASYATGLGLFSVAGGWRGPFIVSAALAAALLALLPPVRESPRWLMMEGRENEARTTMAALGFANVEADAMVADITADLSATQHRPASWLETLAPSHAPTRRMLYVSWGVAVLSKAVGVSTVTNYLPEIVDELGLASTPDQMWGSMAAISCKAIAICISSGLVDLVGRRPLLLFSFLSMAASYVVLVAAMLVAADSTAAIVLGVLGLCLVLAADGSGVSGMANVLLSELAPIRFRAKSLGIALALNSACSSLTTLTYYAVAAKVGEAGVWAIYAAVCVVGAAYAYLLVVETKGLRLEEVREVREQAARSEGPGGGVGRAHRRLGRAEDVYDGGDAGLIHRL